MITWVVFLISLEFNSVPKPSLSNICVLRWISWDEALIFYYRHSEYDTNYNRCTHFAAFVFCRDHESRITKISTQEKARRSPRIFMVLTQSQSRFSWEINLPYFYFSSDLLKLIVRVLSKSTTRHEKQTLSTGTRDSSSKFQMASWLLSVWPEY